MLDKHTEGLGEASARRIITQACTEALSASYSFII